MSAPKADVLIEGLQEQISKFKDTLSFHEKKKAELEAGLISSVGRVRLSYSDEISRRAVQIEGFKIRIKNLEGDLAKAQADFPRREAKRKEAQEFKNLADAADAEARALVTKLRGIEQKAQEFRGKEGACLQEANNLPQDLPVAV